MALNTNDAQEMVKDRRREGKCPDGGASSHLPPCRGSTERMLGSGELGKVYYIYTQRVNLGVIRQDENALLSFAPHDLSVILYLLEEEPLVVTAHGESYIQKGIEDVVFLGLQFSDGKMANIHLSC